MWLERLLAIADTHPIQHNETNLVKEESAVRREELVQRGAPAVRRVREEGLVRDGEQCRG